MMDEKPTIAELEDILDGKKGPYHVDIMPDGSLKATDVNAEILRSHGWYAPDDPVEGLELDGHITTVKDAVERIVNMTRVLQSYDCDPEMCAECKEAQEALHGLRVKEG